jgi:hypothetical protein
VDDTDLVESCAAEQCLAVEMTEAKKRPRGACPEVWGNRAFVPPGYERTDTTYEVPYKKIARGELMPWHAFPRFTLLVPMCSVN